MDEKIWGFWLPYILQSIDGSASSLPIWILVAIIKLKHTVASHI